MCVGHGLSWDGTGVENKKVIGVEDFAVGVDDSAAGARANTDMEVKL